MAEFTGERVIPGQVPRDLLNEHLARYAFAARLSRGKRVLDAGCGAGYGTAELAQGAVEVLGVDISPEAIAYAREHYRSPNLRFEEASCTALPAVDAKFGLIVAFEVIEHLADWRGFLSEVRRVLARNGQFVVSTPNKLYYAETRQRAGPNPFHVHEFEYEEFRAELSAVFPQVSMFLENHSESIIFQPEQPVTEGEIKIEDAEAVPAESHFFLALCSFQPQTRMPVFTYVPRVANVLRERERHIGLLEGELQTKNGWLEKSKQDLARLNQEHQKLLDMFRRQQAELEQRNEWAESLNRQLETSGARIQELQQELSDEQSSARAAIEVYESKIAELEQENRRKTEWALLNEERLGREIEQRGQELLQCVELLHKAEQTVEERTLWAQSAQTETDHLQRQIASFHASRWVKLGRKLGLGPPVRTS